MENPLLDKKLKNKNDRIMLEMVDDFLVGKEFISEYTDIGYTMMAPVLTRYLLWIDKMARENELDGILFTARDGWLLKRMYDYLVRDREEAIPSLYFYTSRKAAILAGLRKEDLNDLAAIPYTEKPRDILKNVFLLSDDKIKDYNAKWSIKEYILKHEKEILDNRELYYINYRKYIKKIKLKENGRYALIDFVASGTVANFLWNIIDFKIVPMYACKYGKNERMDKPNGLSMFKFTDSGYGIKSNFFYENYTLMETVLTSLEPSLTSFDEEGEPVFAKEVRDDEELKYVLNMQNSIFEFFRAYIEKADLVNEVSKDTVDYLYSRLKNGEVLVDCPYLQTLMIHQDIGVEEIKAFKNKVAISVVLTTYNRKYELRRALKSVYNQDVKYKDVIVVDDASNDGTRELIEKEGFPNLQYIELPSRVGAGEAKNIGIEKSTGDYIAFLDSDDEWMPGRMAKVVSIIEEIQINNQNVDIITNSYRKHKKLEYEILPHKERLSTNPWISEADVVLNAFVHSSAAVYNKDYLIRNAGFTKLYTTRIDEELVLRSIRQKSIRIYHDFEELTQVWQMFDGLAEDVNMSFEEKKKLLIEYQELFEKAYNNVHQQNWQEEEKRVLQITQELEAARKTVEKKNSFYQVMRKWLERKINGDDIGNSLIDREIHSILIYGAGKHGELLANDLEKSQVNVGGFIDRNKAGDKILEKLVYSLEDTWPKVDAIVISTFLEYEEIKNTLIVDEDVKIISLKEIIESS